MFDTNLYLRATSDSSSVQVLFLPSFHARITEELPAYTGGTGLVILTFGTPNQLDCVGDDKIEPAIQAESLVQALGTSPSRAHSPHSLAR
jgi:hypothetical protein